MSTKNNMPRPPIPNNEDKRILELNKFEILDTAPESQFDILTELASQICGTKISLISLVDENRQWFKSRFGLETSETPRDISWCGYTILGEEIFEIPDSQHDERFKNNPLFLGPPHVTFYAGAPLITQNGHKIGTICVIDQKPKKLTSWQRSVLEKLAKQVVYLIEGRLREKRLSESITKLDCALQGANLGSWDFDIKENVVSVDQRWYEIIGKKFTKNSMPYAQWEELIHPDDRKKIKSDLKLLLQGLTDSYENIHRVKHTKGHWIWVLNRAKVSQRDDQQSPLRLSGVYFDISSQKQSEQKLRDNEEKVHAIYEGSNDAIMMLSRDGFFDCNQKTLSLFNVSSREEFIKLHPADLSPKYQEDGTLSFEKAQSKIDTAFKRGYNQFEWTHCKLTGEEFPAEVLLSAFTYQNERVLQATVRDISERKKLEELSQDVQRLAKIGGLQFNIEPRSLEWTNEVYRIFGYPYDRPIDLNCMLNFYSYSDRIEMEKLINEAINNGTFWDKEFAIIDFNGKEKWVRSIGEPIQNKHGKIYKIKGTIQDVTEIKHLQQSLEYQRKISQHQAKLASIGQLAAGVGHEINNPLTIIQGHLHNLKNDLKNIPQIKDKTFFIIERIKMASDRIVNIVKGLKTFSRSDTDQLGIFDMREAVEVSLNLLKEMYQKEGVELKARIDNDQQLMAFGNKGRMEQVIINLLSNAKDASEGKNYRIIDVYLAENNDHAHLSVKDNGRGIPENIRDQIFDPFFTTKDVNKGTGIGLSIVSSIIKEHEGKISFETSPGEGTTFNIDIPLYHGEKNGEEIKTIPKPELKENYLLKVLIVDDEEDIRGILDIILSSIGIHVRTAENGEEALTKCSQESFDLIITDLKMPIMNGATLIEKVLSQKCLNHPKIILMTGGIDNKEDELFNTQQTISAILNKPFDTQMLYNQIQELFPEKDWKF